MTLSFTSPAVTLDEANAYCSARGIAAWTGSDTVKSQAILRSQNYFAMTYNGRWKNEWDNDHAPELVKFAIIEGAVRELVKPGSLSPDQKRGGAIKAVGAGSARVEWFDGAPSGTVFNTLDGLIKPELAPSTFGAATAPVLRV